MSLCTKKQRTEQKLDACRAYFGERHCRILTFADDDTSDQDGNYVDLNAIGENYEEKKYVLWGTTDDQTGAPSIASDQELLSYEFDADDTGATRAEAAKTAIEALDPELFSVERVDNVLHVRNKFLGTITEEDDSNIGDDETELGVLGFGGSLGGFAPGGATLSTTVEVEEIRDDQNGEVVLDEIIKGITLSLEMTLAEMTEDRWEALIGKVSGGIVEVGNDKLIGYGTAKNFQSKMDFAGMVVLHPIRLAITDRSSDYVIHRSAPDMQSINFSGSEVQGAEMVFNAYKDDDVNEKVNLFVRGDYTLL